MVEQEEAKSRIGFQSINGLTTVYSSLAPVVSSYLWFTMNKTVLFIKDVVCTQDQVFAYCELGKVCLWCPPGPAGQCYFLSLSAGVRVAKTSTKNFSHSPDFKNVSLTPRMQITTLNTRQEIERTVNMPSAITDMLGREVKTRHW